jgi:bacillithiol system protein YtxJ
MFINLETKDDLTVFMESIKTQSFACLYKHSSTCGMSATAMRQVKKAHEQLANLDESTDLMIGVVVVQTARAVSNLVAEELEVKHESPQLLIFKQ